MLEAHLRASAPMGGHHGSRCLATSAPYVHYTSTPRTLLLRGVGHASSERPQYSILGAKAIHSSSKARLVNTSAAAVADAETCEAAAGPAFKDTLKMLEWRRLCEHLSKHASTALGKRMCLNLEVPIDMPTSVRLLNETR